MSLMPNDFAKGVQKLASAWFDVVPADRGDWQDVRALESGGAYRLRITKVVKPRTPAAPPNGRNTTYATIDLDRDIVRNDEAEESLLQLEEDDPESLTKSASPSTVAESGRQAHYDTVLSPTYQVPVLYVSFPSSDRSPLPSPDEVYDLLVPEQYRAPLQAVGPMSALSMTGEHPVTGGPAYFVHPCLTQDSMRAVMAGRRVSGAAYLAIWFGIVGSTVGLSLPVSLARELQSPG